MDDPSIWNDDDSGMSMPVAASAAEPATSTSRQAQDGSSSSDVAGGDGQQPAVADGPDPSASYHYRIGSTTLGCLWPCVVVPQDVLESNHEAVKMLKRSPMSSGGAPKLLVRFLGTKFEYAVISSNKLRDWAGSQKDLAKVPEKINVRASGTRASFSRAMEQATALLARLQSEGGLQEVANLVCGNATPAKLDVSLGLPPVVHTASSSSASSAGAGEESVHVAGTSGEAGEETPAAAHPAPKAATPKAPASAPASSSAQASAAAAPQPYVVPRGMLFRSFWRVAPAERGTWPVVVLDDETANRIEDDARLMPRVQRRTAAAVRARGQGAHMVLVQNFMDLTLEAVPAASLAYPIAPPLPEPPASDAAAAGEAPAPAASSSGNGLDYAHFSKLVTAARHSKVAKGLSLDDPAGTRSEGLLTDALRFAAYVGQQAARIDSEATAPEGPASPEAVTARKAVYESLFSLDTTLLPPVVLPPPVDADEGGGAAAAGAGAAAGGSGEASKAPSRGSRRQSTKAVLVDLGLESPGAALGTGEGDDGEAGGGGFKRSRKAGGEEAAAAAADQGEAPKPKRPRPSTTAGRAASKRPPRVADEHAPLLQRLAWVLYLGSYWPAVVIHPAAVDSGRKAQVWADYRGAGGAPKALVRYFDNTYFTAKLPGAGGKPGAKAPIVFWPEPSGESSDPEASAKHAEILAIVTGPKAKPGMAEQAQQALAEHAKPRADRLGAPPAGYVEPAEEAEDEEEGAPEEAPAAAGSSSAKKPAASGSARKPGAKPTPAGPALQPAASSYTNPSAGAGGAQAGAVGGAYEDMLARFVQPEGGSSAAAVAAAPASSSGRMAVDSGTDTSSSDSDAGAAAASARGKKRRLSKGGGAGEGKKKRRKPAAAADSDDGEGSDSGSDAAPAAKRSRDRKDDGGKARKSVAFAKGTKTREPGTGGKGGGGKEFVPRSRSGEDDDDPHAKLQLVDDEDAAAAAEMRAALEAEGGDVDMSGGRSRRKSAARFLESVASGQAELAARRADDYEEKTGGSSKLAIASLAADMRSKAGGDKAASSSASAAASIAAIEKERKERERKDREADKARAVPPPPPAPVKPLEPTPADTEAAREIAADISGGMAQGGAGGLARIASALARTRGLRVSAEMLTPLKLVQMIAQLKGAAYKGEPSPPQAGGAPDAAAAAAGGDGEDGPAARAELLARVQAESGRVYEAWRGACVALVRAREDYRKAVEEVLRWEKRTGLKFPVPAAAAGDAPASATPAALVSPSGAPAPASSSSSFSSMLAGLTAKAAPTVAPAAPAPGATSLASPTAAAPASSSSSASSSAPGSSLAAAALGPPPPSDGAYFRHVGVAALAEQLQLTLRKALPDAAAQLSGPHAGALEVAAVTVAKALAVGLEAHLHGSLPALAGGLVALPLAARRGLTAEAILEGNEEVSTEASNALEAYQDRVGLALQALASAEAARAGSARGGAVAVPSSAAGASTPAGRLVAAVFDIPPQLRRTVAAPAAGPARLDVDAAVDAVEASAVAPALSASERAALDRALPLLHAFAAQQVASSPQ